MNGLNDQKQSIEDCFRLRHRHRLQGRHLLSTSISSSLDDRRRGGNGHLHSSTFGDPSNSLINVTNGNNNDILPAVGMYSRHGNNPR